jgi:hypothetical protein
LILTLPSGPSLPIERLGAFWAAPVSATSSDGVRGNITLKAFTDAEAKLRHGLPYSPCNPFR